MSKDPLRIRLYFEPSFTAVARMVGYSGLPLPEAQTQAKELAKQYPKEKIAEAARELTDIDNSTDPPTLRLKPEARKAASQLLGHDPEDKLYLFKKYGPPNIMGEEAALSWIENYCREKAKENGPAEEPEQPKRRTKKGRGK